MDLDYLQKHWKPIHRNRLEWAYRANKIFFNSIESDLLKEKIDTKTNKEISVCTIGKSQVGKTSLILKLLEIKAEKFSELSKKLRGGSIAGNSSTSTAMIYSKSEDNFFYFSENEIEEKLDINSLENKLKYLRERVEKNSLLNFNKPIHIKIAKDYFAENSNFPLKIIDLPGQGSSNLKENNHVEEVVQRYASIATTIIFVSRIENIASLKTLMDSYSLSKYYPDKCKVVLTFAFSAETVRKKINDLIKKEMLTTSSFEETINKDLKETFKENFEKYKFFPLEYGESMETELKKHFISAKESIETIINSILYNLKNEIQTTSSEYFQLMQNYKLPKIIRNLIHERENQHTKDEENNSQKIKIENDKKKKYEVMLSEQEQEINQLRSLENIEKDELLYENIKPISITIEKYLPDDTNTNAFINSINDFCDKFYSELKIIYGKIGNSIISKQTLSEEFKPLKRKLEKYSTNEYYPSWSDSWADDNLILKECIKKCLVKYNKEIEDRKIFLLKKIQKEKKKVHSKINKSYKLKILINQINNCIGDIEREISLSNNKYNTELQSLNNDLKRSESFLEFLDIEFLEEIKNLEDLRKISKEEKFFRLIKLALISKEYKNLQAEKG